MEDRRGYGREGRGNREGHDIKPNYFLPKPVKVGDILEVTIDAIASKGDGIAKKDGFVIFVSGAKQGDKVRVRITDVRARYATGEKLGEASSAASSEPSPEPSGSDEGTEEGAEA
ncbi:MAG: TRAM domain-containing protein [Candidatus Micrarchaeaceae archaeon]